MLSDDPVLFLDHFAMDDIISCFPTFYTEIQYLIDKVTAPGIDIQSRFWGILFVMQALHYHPLVACHP